MPKVMPENYSAWELWHQLNESDRPNHGFGPGKIPRAVFAQMCELYDLTLEDFEKAIYLENVFYPEMAKLKEKE